ncbi:Fe-S cluster assembly protein SufD [Prosthecomicrobium pneumaticum]|uniref:Fe-S cluster assembly protein SufD n=1 Tax=Prosthecomicrobium pneumaticum TaxID=81895 RepID=A0A7W9L3L4_9HYPH|nr:Fe-S cluster assembly protein SufD [Prosthecomicrobium pneumaticum]MBB5754644.1 Fe-S cluster assembly protein SufD [Prosthecomicrobium pneumaticum]
MNAEPRILRTQAEETLAAEFQAARTRLAGGPETAARREAAFAAFQKAGLPHRRVEAWRYTDLRALMRKAAPLAEPGAVPAGLPAVSAFGGARLVIVDGSYRPELSDADGLDGVTIRPLADLLAADDPRVGASLAALDDPLVALNTALMTGGVAIDVAPGASVGRMIELAHVTTGAHATQTRNLVHVGADASLRLVETHTGPDGAAYQANGVTEAVIGDRARVVWAKLQQEGDAALHVGTLALTAGRETRFDHLVLMIGAVLSRSQQFVTLSGPEAKIGMNGATMLRGRQHADIALVVDHTEPACESRERFKAVVDGEAEAIFQGRIVVKPQAQKTDARMMTQGLLLSEGGQFSAKPELEIFADDVQCAHGATSGQIDEDLLFYLLARGIPRPEAETLLVTAFLAEAIEALGDETIAAVCEAAATRWLAARGGA